MGMREGRLSALMALLLATCIIAEPVSSNHEVDERFLGGWQLSALEEIGADGQVNAAECTGLLIFTADGHMSVQVMYLKGAGGSNRYSQGGYEASFGKYEIDRGSHRLIYYVEAALVRPLVGQSQQRLYAFLGDKLIITPADPKEHWRVTWKRYSER
jgi:Lipocalin-like domain